MFYQTLIHTFSKKPVLTITKASKVLTLKMNANSAIQTS